MCPGSAGWVVVLAGLQHVGFARRSAHAQALETQVASEQAEGRAVLPQGWVNSVSPRSPHPG